MIKNGKGGLLMIKSVQRLGLFGDKKDEVLNANLWEVFSFLELEVIEEDYKDELRKNSSLKNKKTR